MEAAKKMIFYNRRITIGEVVDDVGIRVSFGSCQAIFMDILDMKRAAARFVSKFPKFLARTTSHGHRSEDVDDVQRRPRFGKKCHNW